MNVPTIPGAILANLSPRPSFLAPLRYAKMDSHASTAHNPSFSLHVCHPFSPHDCSAHGKREARHSRYDLRDDWLDSASCATSQLL